MRIQLAARHAETQGLQAEHSVGKHQVGIEVVKRQLFAVDDALAGEFDIRVHVAPAFSLEFLDRQHLVGRLLAVATTCFLFGVGIRTDQRREVGKQQLVGNQCAAEFRPWLSGQIGQAAVNIAFADLAVEFFVAEQRTARFMQLGDQMAVRSIRRGVRKCDARQWIQVAKARARQLQA